MSGGYRLWVNFERTVLVRLWDNGTVEVETRPHPAETWGPPVTCEEETWGPPVTCEEEKV